MSQTRSRSLAESLANVVVGYGVGVAAQIAVFPILGVRASVKDNLIFSGCMTIVSVVRSYLLRRAFNRADARNPRRNAFC